MTPPWRSAAFLLARSFWARYFTVKSRAFRGASHSSRNRSQVQSTPGSGPAADPTITPDNKPMTFHGSLESRPFGPAPATGAAPDARASTLVVDDLRHAVVREE